MKKEILPLLLLLTTMGACKSEQEKRDIQPVRVKTITLNASADAAGGQGYSGTVEEMSGSTLSFSGVGTLQSLQVSEGQFVGQGQLIGLIDDTSARQVYDAAAATKRQADDALARMTQLHEAGSLPDIKWVEVQTQVQQATSQEELARKALSDTKLYAPFAGYVAQKLAETGTNVAPGVPVIKLVRIDKVKVTLSVPEGEISSVRRGQPVSVQVYALGGKTFTGEVAEKGVSANPLTRSYEVKAVIDNPRHELLPGMVCTAILGSQQTVAGDSPTRLSIPADIIQIDYDNRPFVWTVDAESQARRAYIEIGENVGNNVIVGGGLKVGDVVIVEDQQKVSTGMKVEG